jgi:type II secretory pathway component GspD/PulD (secretin)
VAVQAAETDSHASIIQRPRIQTSQAKPAQFFVGQTIPYVTSTYNSGVANYGGNSYSQMSVGVELDVTPFINPDGLVVMDIQQEIDDVVPGAGQNVGGGVSVPETDKRTLSSEIAVKTGDTVMLGGFIKNQKSTSKSGVPFLMDIPLLGNLFSSRSDNKNRTELIVLMRPTVLRTPELAAAQALKEKERLPGVSAALTEEVRTEHELVEAEKKAELKRAEADQKAEQKAEQKRQRSQPQSQSKFFQPVPPDSAVDTNAVAIPNP